MIENKNQKLLTISIPTYNRGVLVKELLENITKEISDNKLEDKVEVQITNNASTDDTESIIQGFAARFDFIHYTNNGVNIGLGPNVLKCMYLAKGKYCLLLGDDDRLKENKLPVLINFLESNPDVGLFVDTTNHKKSKVEKATDLSLVSFLEKYYYFMGNAGVFVVLSSYIQENYDKKDFDGISFSWPQTQFMIISANKHPENRIHLDNFYLQGESEHANITLYNSYYLWKVAYFELVEDIENIRQWISPEAYQAAKKYFADNAMQNFFNILQCGVFLDTKDIKAKTRKHISEHLTHFSTKEKFLLRIIMVVLWLPGPMARILSDVFIFLIRGSKGLEKKNTFVNGEKKKMEIIKSKKETIIREFSFEGARS